MLHMVTDGIQHLAATADIFGLWIPKTSPEDRFIYQPKPDCTMRSREEEASVPNDQQLLSQFFGGKRDEADQIVDGR